MEAQSWIIGQIIIDVIIAVLLMWFIRFHIKKKEPLNNPGTLFQKSDRILSEMRELSRHLDKNLEEKRELSRNILGQLDEGLQRAEEIFQQVQNIVREYGTNMAPVPDSLRDSHRIRSSVNALLAKGLSREEIAQHLGISAGEIDLLIRLQARSKDPNLRAGK